jgi:hypothetical protein
VDQACARVEEDFKKITKIAIKVLAIGKTLAYTIGANTTTLPPQ